MQSLNVNVNINRIKYKKKLSILIYSQRDLSFGEIENNLKLRSIKIRVFFFILFVLVFNEA